MAFLFCLDSQHLWQTPIFFFLLSYILKHNNYLLFCHSKYSYQYFSLLRCIVLFVCLFINTLHLKCELETIFQYHLKHLNAYSLSGERTLSCANEYRCHENKYFRKFFFDKKNESRVLKVFSTINALHTFLGFYSIFRFYNRLHEWQMTWSIYKVKYSWLK